VTDHGEVTWQTDSEFIGANHAEHAMVGDYELLVFDLPADCAGPAVIGWELFGPSDAIVKTSYTVGVLCTRSASVMA
jgi:hypothetical protein